MKRYLLLLILLAIPSAYAIQGLKISVYADDILTAGTTYTKLFKIENLDHVSGVTDHINATVGYNISDVKEDIFELKNLNKYKYANTGEFTPEQTGEYTICGWIINSTVDDTNKEDDTACKTVTVIGSSQTNESSDEEILEKESWIKIKDIPNEASFGDMIDVEVEIYKGETRKYAVYVKLEKISEKITVHLKGKYTEYSLKIPVQIKPNCNEKYEEGEYVLEVEGLDASDEEEIDIYGFNEDMCKTEEIIINETIVINETKTEIVKEKCPSKDKLFDVAKIKLTSDLTTGRIVYESSSWKAYKLVPLLIIAVLIMLCAVLIWKR